MSDDADALAVFDEPNHDAATAPATVRRRWPGRLAAILGIVTVAFTAAAVTITNLAALDDSQPDTPYYLAAGLAIAAVALSALAVVVGFAAVIGKAGRALGIVGVVLGVIGDPLIVVFVLNQLEQTP